MRIVEANSICEIDGFPGYGVDRCGGTWTKRPQNQWGAMTLEWKQLRQSTRRGYRFVGMYVNGKHLRRAVHRLVLSAFIGECPNGMEACHINGLPGDNRLENLRWDTKLNNHADRRRHGTIPSGPQHGRAKLTVEQIGEILKLHELGISTRLIAQQFDVDKGTIRRIFARQQHTICG